MKGNITKEQIVETALALIKNKSDLHGLNLREVARTLGCAHTNIYNYFPSYSDLLWETHTTLHEVFMKMLIKKLDTTNTAEIQLAYFFEAFAQIYMENKGWFRLAWHEHIEGERPGRNIEVLEETNKVLTQRISEIWMELSETNPGTENISRVLHNTHCYIVGEVSNYLLGRGLIENEAELKVYIAREAVRMFKLCLSDIA